MSRAADLLAEIVVARLDVLEPGGEVVVGGGQLRARLRDVAQDWSRSSCTRSVTSMAGPIRSFCGTPRLKARRLRWEYRAVFNCIHSPLAAYQVVRKSSLTSQGDHG